MKEIFYKTEIFDREHIYSGGIIYLSDFNTDCRKKDAKGGSAIAARIAADLNRGRNREQTQIKKETRKNAQSRAQNNREHASRTFYCHE